MAGIIIFLNSCLDIENLILGKFHYLIFYLVLAIYPRMLFTVNFLIINKILKLNENLENFPTTVRVG